MKHNALQCGEMCHGVLQSMLDEATHQHPCRHPEGPEC